MIELKEGDIYRWSYREPGDDRMYGRYHCCSRIAIVTKGRLRDTFWGSGSDNRSFGPDDLAKLELRHLGNLADLERADEWKAEYYDDADIVDLNHSNSTKGNFYLRKGAKESAAKMLATARYKLERAESNKHQAEREIERLTFVIAQLETGTTAVHV